MKKLLILLTIFRVQGGDSETLPDLQADSEAMCETSCGNPKLSPKLLKPNYSFWHLTHGFIDEASDSFTSVDEADDECLDKIDLSVGTMEKEIKELEEILNGNRELLNKLTDATNTLISGMDEDTSEDGSRKIGQYHEESDEYFDAVSHRDDNEESDEYFDAETGFEKSDSEKDEKVFGKTAYLCDQYDIVDLKSELNEDAQNESSEELSEQTNCESDNKKLRGKCEDETEEGSDNLGESCEMNKDDENSPKMNGFVSFLNKIRHFISYFLL